MDTRFGSGCLYYAFSILALWTTSTTAYIQLAWNSTHSFGPDGPWNAVVVGVDYTASRGRRNINLLPLRPASYFPMLWAIGAQTCEEYPAHDSCGIGGTLEVGPAAYTANASSYVAFTDAPGGWRYNLTGYQSGAIVELTPGQEVSNANIGISNISANTYYPSGIQSGLEIGFLNLGDPTYDQSTRDNIPLYLYRKGLIQSPLYSLHIGSAPLKYQGSLIFGGYDRNRVIGPVITTIAGGLGAVQLVDIVIGVETGGSPFNFSSKPGLLLPGSSTASSLPAQVYPEVPYIALPPDAVDAITSNLPVHFDSKSGYYLWNTHDAAYSNIVSSAAYLGFEFASATGNIVIKVSSFKRSTSTIRTTTCGNFRGCLTLLSPCWSRRLPASTSYKLT